MGYTVFSNGGVVDLGEGWKTVVIPNPQMGMGNLNAPGQTTNSWLNTEIFLQAWQLVFYDGRFKKHEWILKVDPDPVFFPDRLRDHMRPHTAPGVSAFVMNCDLFQIALYGSLEVFSKQAMLSYYNGKDRCRTQLNWHGWGEDMFTQKCLLMLGVQVVNGFDLIGDKRCHAAPCWDTSKVAFHDFKSVPAWFDCWKQSQPGLNEQQMHVL